MAALAAPLRDTIGFFSDLHPFLPHGRPSLCTHIVVMHIVPFDVFVFLSLSLELSICDLDAPPLFAVSATGSCACQIV